MPRTISNQDRAEQASKRLGGTDPAGRQWRHGDELHEIEAALQAFDAADDRLHDTVVAARTAGYSWASIGAVLGVSKQAAQQRFG
jgi:hypothetical protein